MAEVIRMPKMSDTMEEGVIASWLKKEGDEVSSGDILAEVETDKATMELESYQDGVLLYIGVKEKESVAVDGILAVIGEKGEDYKHLLNGSGEEKEEASAEQPKEEKKESSKKSVDTSNINASIIRMPKMSDTMEEGVIASWLKKVGDAVEAGDILAEVETDKATMELEAYEDGELLYTAVEAGNGVAVDGVIAIIGEKGADYQVLLDADSAPANETPAPEEKKEESVSQSSVKPAAQITPSSASSSNSSSNGRVKASPLAKKIASEKGIDIAQVNGSGTDGRIVKKDVEEFTPSASTSTKAPTETGSSVSIPSVVGEENSREVPLSQMRKAIAKTLAGSKYSAPHFYVTMEINMDKAIEARKSMNEVSPVKISFNDMVVKATGAALRQHPDINVSFAEGKIIMHDHIHIGVAVAIPDGLVVPTVKFVDNKSLSHISAEIKELGQKAKDKKLQPEEYQGGTFTISNLGMFGVDEFTAIIYQPASCILAVGGIKETVIVENGQMRPGNLMKVTLSSDHRTVDGAVAAAFLKTLKGLLEDPVRILI